MDGALPTAEWPEPIQRVQSLAESGISELPPQYIKPEKDRPATNPAVAQDDEYGSSQLNIPVIDLRGLEDGRRESTMRQISDACREWGFFQVVNHGVPLSLVQRARDVSREFFHLPLEEKQVYANNPKTYEGYGSRLGIEKGAILDWGDYFFQHFLPLETMDEYSKEIAKLCRRTLSVLSINLGLDEGFLNEAFGGEDIGLCMRMNYYPKCPQPNLALGLSSHSDPGGLTVLLPDELVRGLQVRKGNTWVLVDPVPNAFIINIGDQVQILSNGIYRSVEHRVMVNSLRERVSIAMFYNPKGDKVLSPAKDLVNEEMPPLYEAMTYNQYRLYIRQKGPTGKTQVDSIAKRC
eukprot:Gb_01811 [translate_table: standard]